MFPCSILPGSWMDNVRTSTCLKRPTKALVYHHVSPSIIPDMFVYTVITIVETTMSNMIPMLLVMIVCFCHVSQTPYLHWTMIMTSVHHDKQWLFFPTFSLNSWLSSPSLIHCSRPEGHASRQRRMSRRANSPGSTPQWVDVCLTNDQLWSKNKQWSIA